MGKARALLAANPPQDEDAYTDGEYEEIAEEARVGESVRK